MPTAQHDSWWWCLNFRQCHSTSPWMRESAAAALLSSLISQHGAQKQPYIPSGLQEAMGIKETLSRIQPQSKEGERAVFAAAIHFRVPSMLWTILKTRSAIWCERQISVFWKCLVHLTQNAEHFSWKTSLLHVQYIEEQYLRFNPRKFMPKIIFKIFLLWTCPKPMQSYRGYGHRTCRSTLSP